MKNNNNNLIFGEKNDRNNVRSIINFNNFVV